MNFLVDTHLLLWTVCSSPKLPSAIREIFSNPDSTCFFSAASIWEIAIKRSKRPALLPFSAATARELFLSSGFRELPISSRHCLAVEDLPPVHSDPFDRLLVAQAKTSQMKFLTHDRLLASYGDFVVSV